MPCRLRSLLVFVALAPCCGVVAQAPARPRVIVLLRAGADDAATLRRTTARRSMPGLVVMDAADAAVLAGSAGVERVVTDRPIAASSLRVQGAATPSAQGWAVRQAGGFGAAGDGPWTVTRGAGVRIAVLDSGVDRAHPAITPNLVLNLSEVDQSAATGMPSPCDDGSPQDQQGHGTWAASLAAGAQGSSAVGVAPEASLLNIKVMQRMPAVAGDASTCAGGQASGMLSWLVQGIADAVAQHADIVSLSLGTLVDLQTGDGAGVKAVLDRATHAAAAAGVLVIAAAGNDAFPLDSVRYAELPAQSRDVLAVVASTNPQCAQDLHAGAACNAGPVSLAYYSNYGEPLHALAAPGGSYPNPAGTTSGWIEAACSEGLPGTADGLPAQAGHSFGCFGLGHAATVAAIGTSASAPLTAGAAALVKAAHMNWTADQIVTALRQAALPAGTLPVAEVSILTLVAPALSGTHHEVKLASQ